MVAVPFRRNRWVRAAYALLNACVFLLVAGRAQAQAPDRLDDRPTAEALFAAGREAVRRGDYRAACPMFAESNRLDPALGTVLNLAICEEHIGRLASAWQRYQEVIHGLEASDGRLPLARANAAALEKRLPRLTIRLSPKAPKETRVSRGAGALTSASFGVALPIDPGRHEIVAVSPGRQPRRYRAELGEGVRKELIVEPGPPALEPPRRDTRVPPKGNVERGSSFQRTAGFVIGGVGIGGLVASAITGILVLDRKQTVERECGGGLCSDAGISAGDSGQKLAAVSTIAFTVGLVGVASGAYLVVSSTTAQARSSATSLLQLGGPF
jgi:hypothetical protein